MGKKNYKNRQKKKTTKHSNSSKGKGDTKIDFVDWEKYFQEYQESLKPKGLCLRDVESDGNCLFRAVADQLEGTEKNHRKYRDEAAEYITQHKEHFKIFLLDTENIDSYIKRLEENGTWGGHFELIALSDIHKVQFHIHMKDQNSVIVKSDNIQDDAKVLHIAYHVGEHYSSIRKIDDIGESPAQEIPMSFFSKSSEK